MRQVSFSCFVLLLLIFSRSAWAFVGDGTTDNAAALNAALAALPNSGGMIYFPAGKYLIGSPISKALFSGKSTIAIKGDGPGVTVLYWPSGSGLSFIYTDLQNSVILKDISLSTGAAGGATGLMITNSASALSNANIQFEQTIIQSVTLEGDIKKRQYWSTAIQLQAVSAASFSDLYVQGGGGINGAGVVLTGRTSAPAVYGILFNFTRCVFNDLGIGIEYGSFVQGVTVTQSNFNGGTTGIHSSAGAIGVLSQLAVSDSQFNTSGTQILLETGVQSVQLINVMMFIPALQMGLRQVGGLYTQVTNSLFMGTGTPGGNGVDISGEQLGANIVGNTFRTLNIGVALQPSSRHVNVQGNLYSGTTVDVNDLGVSNSIGIATK